MTAVGSRNAKLDDIALAVRIGEKLHGIPIAAVEEVLPALPIESIPQCPDFIRGVVFVRGHLIPVLDAAERLAVRDYARPLEPHIVCLRVGDRLVGVEVDEALDLIDVSQGVRAAAEEVGARRGFFTGVVDLDGTIIRMLDPQKLLAADEQADLDQVPRTA